MLNTQGVLYLVAGVVAARWMSDRATKPASHGRQPGWRRDALSRRPRGDHIAGDVTTSPDL
jgi:hypothetical protein